MKGSKREEAVFPITWHYCCKLLEQSIVTDNISWATPELLPRYVTQEIMSASKNRIEVQGKHHLLKFHKTDMQKLLTFLNFTFPNAKARKTTTTTRNKQTKPTYNKTPLKLLQDCDRHRKEIPSLERQPWRHRNAHFTYTSCSI